VRARIESLLDSTGDPALREGNVSSFFVRQTDAQMVLPVEIGDYVDFYSSLEHATNLGRLFRPGGEPLLPNWRHIPIGYHGRSSTIVVDGTPIVRPNGQRKPASAQTPEFGPSTRLDIELEIGFITGPGNELGVPIPIEKAREHIFGLVLVNDWSARDIQAWEYQPLGPFLGKSFATTISPWIVPLAALEPFRVPAPAPDPPPLPYLQTAEAWAYDIALAVDLCTATMRERGAAPRTIARTNFREMYWTMAQQLAHVTANGTAVRPGDLYASGTISGSGPAAQGSLIELSWNGAHAIDLGDGETRTFLEDGDEVALRGWCEAGGVRVGFGQARGLIVAAP
jgi:fumarylacetoacetase